MAFGVTVGAKCSPTRCAPPQHIFVCHEMLDPRKTAAHTAKALGREHRFQHIDFDDAVSTEKAFSVFGAWSAFYIDSPSKTQRVFGHPSVHAIAVLEPLCESNVIGMRMGDE